MIGHGNVPFVLVVLNSTTMASKRQYRPKENNLKKLYRMSVANEV